MKIHVIPKSNMTARLTTTSLNIYRRKDGHGRWLVVARDTKGARIQSEDELRWEKPHIQTMWEKETDG